MWGAIFEGLNAFLSVGSLALGITSQVMQAKIKQFAEKINNLSASFSPLVNSAKDFQKNLSIITSPILQTQHQQVDILLKANVQQLQEYFDFISKFMKQDNIDSLDTIKSKLPGSNLGLNILGYGLLGASLLFSVYGTYKTVKLFKEWNAQRKINDQNIDILADPESQVRIEGFKIGNVPKSMKNPFEAIKDANVPQFENNSASLKDYFRAAKIKFTEFYQKSSKTIGHIMTGVGILVNLAGIGLSIWALVNQNGEIKDLQQQYNTVKSQYDEFYTSCLKVLKTIVSFLDSLHGQLLSFAIYLKGAQMICTHNIIAASVQAKNKWGSSIRNLQMEKLNNQTFEEITNAKTEMIAALKDMNITVEVDAQGNQKYTAHQTQDQTIKQFQAATTVFNNLDAKIGIVNIFNTFYQVLQLSQTLLKQLPFTKPLGLVKLVVQIKQYVEKKDVPLDVIQIAYKSNFGIKFDAPLTQADRYLIAQIISFATKVFPIGTTNNTVYGYDLNTFTIKTYPDTQVSSTTQMQDINIDDIMETWPNDKKQQSLQHISQAMNVNPSDLSYTLSSIYIKNAGLLDKPNWQLSRLQLFTNDNVADKTKYYVLYNFDTNLFQQVVKGQLLNCNPNLPQKGQSQQGSDSKEPNQPNPKSRDTLSAGMSLSSGQYLTSQNGIYFAVIQTDGNFVVYKGATSGSQNAIWASKSNLANSQQQYTLIMQADGNLVIYNSNKSTWATNTYAPNNPTYHLSILNDGTLAMMDVYDQLVWSSTKGYNSILSSGSSMISGSFIRSTNGQFYALMQTDGNFVVYNGLHFYQSQYTVWASGSYQGGSSKYYLAMQGDGNLVIYHQGTPIWANKSSWRPNPVNFNLSLLNNGALIISDENGQLAWTSSS